MKAWSVTVLCFFSLNAMSQTSFTYDQLPTALKEKASVVFLGKYERFRGPCMPFRMKNGKRGRRWRSHQGFYVEELKKGTMKANVIQVNTLTLPKDQTKVAQKLELYGYYWLLLKPGAQSKKRLAERRGQLNYIMPSGEVLAILPAYSKKD